MSLLDRLVPKPVKKSTLPGEGKPGQRSEDGRPLRRFRYRAYNAQSEEVRGELWLAAATLAYPILRARGLSPIEVKEKPRFFDEDLHKKSVKSEVVAEFTYNLGVLIRSRIGMTAALTTLAEEQEDRGFRAILLELADAEQAGRPLGEVAAEFPNVFPKFYVGILSTADQGARLDGVLMQLARNLEQQDDMVKNMIKEIREPLMLFVAAMGVGAFAIVWGIPQILQYFTQLSVQTPLATRIVLEIGKIIQYGWPYMLAVAVAGTITVFVMRKNDRDRKQLDALVLRLPVVGKIVRTVVLERVLRTLAAMYAAGVKNMTVIMDTAADAAGNLVYRDALRDVGSKVDNGIRLPQAIADTGLFPPSARQMFILAETSDPARQMEVAADFQQHSLKRQLEKAIVYARPILAMIPSIAVGLLLVAIVSLVFGLNATLGAPGK